jgi:Ni2+-binding GTPase involved in maturation of urease and hydrogenase
MFVSQEGKTALIWAATRGHKEVVKALIAKKALVDAKQKVRLRYSVSTGEDRISTQSTGRKCPMHCFCCLYHGDQLTCVCSLARKMC